jgi:hypothetical protein
MPPFLWLYSGYVRIRIPEWSMTRKLSVILPRKRTLSQANGNSVVHIRWYATAPVNGQPLSAHQDADVILNGVLLNSFVLNQTVI